jgi:hypothetical protein
VEGLWSAATAPTTCRYEVLSIWTRSRNTLGEAFDMTENSIDIRVKRLF